MYTALSTTDLLIYCQARQQKFVMSWSGRKLNFFAVPVLCLFFKILLLIFTNNKIIFNCISCEKHCTKNKKHSFCLSSKHNCKNSKQLITAKLAIRLMIANKQEKVEWAKDVTFKWLEQTDSFASPALMRSLYGSILQCSCTVAPLQLLHGN